MDQLKVERRLDAREHTSDRDVKVLHVVASGQRRGAEMFAADLVMALKHQEISQRVAVLRGCGRIDTPFSVPASVVGHRRSASGLGLGTVRALRQIIIRWQPDIIQAHGGEPLKYSLLAGLGQDQVVVYRRIGSAHPRTTLGLRRPIYGAMMRRATLVVALSESIRLETIREYGVSPARIVTIPNGVDVRRLKPRRSAGETRRNLGLPDSAHIVLTLGALTWEKDPFAQLEVARRVLRVHEDGYFVMVGDGPLRGAIEHRIRRLGMEGRVMLAGNRPDVGDLFAISDLLLLGSRTEGVPASVIEAGLAGIPVVAPAIGGIGEAVLNRRTGYLVHPGNTEALAAPILRLLRNSGERQRMGQAAQEWCRSRFDIGLVAPQYRDLYAGLARR